MHPIKRELLSRAILGTHLGEFPETLQSFHFMKAILLSILLLAVGSSTMAMEYIYECILEQGGVSRVYYCKYEDSECLKKLEEKRREVRELGLRMKCAYRFMSEDE